MPGWIIAAALGSIAISAILTFVLWRINQPMLERNKRNGDGSGGGEAAVVTDGGRRDAEVDNGGSDGGGGDGGGD